MANHIEWYLVELERRLKRSVPGDVLESVLAETSSHLYESAEDLTPEHGSMARAEAVRRFGKPSYIAQLFLKSRDSRHQGSWKHAVAIAILVSVMGAIFVAMFELTFRTGSRVEHWLLAPAALLVCGIAYITARAKRLIITPIAAGGAVCFLLALGYGIVGLIDTDDPHVMQLMPRSTAKEHLARFEREARELPPAIKQYEKVTAEIRPVAGDLPNEWTVHYVKEPNPGDKRIYIPEIQSLGVGVTVQYAHFDSKEEAGRYLFLRSSMGNDLLSSSRWYTERAQHMVKAIPEALQRPLEEQLISALPFAGAVAAASMFFAMAASLLAMAWSWLRRMARLRPTVYA